MWDIRYRPLKFTEVLGQPGSVQLLKSRLKNGTAFDTNYIFAGGHGQGKTTLARIHARAMLCQQINKEDPEPCNECDNCQTILSEQPGAFVERDAASQGTIENIRAIVDDLPFAIQGAPKRIYLFDEAHRMGTGAQDVLLKPLEEKKMVGIFCTTEPEKIRGPIRSRCEEYTIRKVTREDVLVRMKDVLAKENVEAQDDAVLIVIDYSGGHVRDVLNKLEMISQMGAVTVESVREYLRLSVVSLYYEILLALPEPKKAIELVEQACDRSSPEDVAAGLAEAAMNSYRLANGMFADFVYVDRNLGKKVYEKYGQNVIVFAEHFLNSRYVTRVGLLRDVLALAQSPGNTPEAKRQVVYVVTQGTTPVEGVVVGAVAVPQPAVQAAPTSPPTVTAAPAAPAAAPAPANSGNPAVPPLTSLDHHLGLDTKPMPRMVGHTPQKLVFPEKLHEDGDRRSMQPDDWRREFETSWPSRGSGGG